MTFWLAMAGSLPALAQPPEAPAGEETPAADSEVDALIRLLEDDEARGRLIERLQAERASSPAGEVLLSEQTFAGRLAEYTRGVAEGAAGAFAAMVEVTGHVRGMLTGAVTLDLQQLRATVLRVALLVAATFGVYLTLQLGFRRLQRSLAVAAANADIFKRAKSIGVCGAFDIGTVLVAWGAGYVFALNIGPPGQAGVEQSLFLNAFLINELIKAGARTALAPRWPVLRVTRMDDTSAAYWYFWLSRLISVVGYTFLFVAPLLAATVSGDLAEAVRIVVLFTALAVCIAIILQNRDTVRARLLDRAAADGTRLFTRSLATLARIWHVVAIVYLIAVFALWVADPETALPFALAATGQTAVTILIGAVLSAFIARLASGGMHLSPDIKARLPLLETRLNAFVPNVLRVVRAIITLAVLVTIVQVWHIANVTSWLTSATGQRVVGTLISVTLILLAGGVIYLAVQSWIEYRLNPLSGAITTARERTLLALFRNAFTIVLGTLVFMLALSELGVNIGPLLAGAGVVGLAVGFGAQKLVQDVINGAFIQLENTMNEGDVVSAGGITGVVERLTIRSVSLRSLDGAYHVIPFSSVDTVTNLMKHFSYHVAEIGVAYRENIAEVKQAMEEAFQLLLKTDLGPDIIGDFEMQGVTEFADSAVIVRARIKTVPGKHWALGRAYNEFVKQVFDERGIEIPFPHVTLYLGEDKDGNAPPLRLLDVEAAAPATVGAVEAKSQHPG